MTDYLRKTNRAFLSSFAERRLFHLSTHTPAACLWCLDAQSVNVAPSSCHTPGTTFGSRQRSFLLSATYLLLSLLVLHCHLLSLKSTSLPSNI